LKKEHQVLTIFDRNVFDTAGYQKAFSFLPNPMYAFALPRKSKTGKIYIKINKR